jgi:hypothetical protein
VAAKPERVKSRAAIVRPGRRVPIASFATNALLFALFVGGTGVATLAGIALVIYVPYALVGAILIARRPENRIGWLLTTVAWSFALGFLPVRGTIEELTTLTAPPVVLAVAWFKASWSFPLTVALIASLALLFPSGRLTSGRWRRPAIVVLLALGAITLGAALWPVMDVLPEGASESIAMPNPFLLLPAWLEDGSGTFRSAAGPLAFALLVTTIVSLLVRYARSEGVERLQLRWLVTGLASVVVAVPAGFVLYAAFGPAIEGLAWTPAIVAFTLPPIAIGVAVLRYRLYEIDRIISRTIGWAIVTGILLAVFGSAVLGLQAILADVTQGETVAVAASTLVAFALFQPLRRRVQSAVNQRFDRARVDGERTAAAFADRLRDQVDLDGVEADIAATVASALRPSFAGVWLRGTAR